MITMDAYGDVTTNHETIRHWAQSRDANPARAADAGESELRFAFPETEQFEEISWTSFFESFEREELAFVYHPEPDRAAEPNRFYKFVDRATV